MTAPSGERRTLPYQELLRGLGAYLDGIEAQRVVILETREGFALRYQNGQDEDLCVTEMHRDDALRHSAPSGLWPNRSHGRYQDFFRALGHELEEEGAWSLLLDEMDDGYLLTYHCLDPRNRYQPVKKRAFLGPAEQGVILEQARGRRAPLPNTDKNILFAWLFG